MKFPPYLRFVIFVLGGDLPTQKLLNLKAVLESNFCQSVKEVIVIFLYNFRSLDFFPLAVHVINIVYLISLIADSNRQWTFAITGSVLGTFYRGSLRA